MCAPTEAVRNQTIEFVGLLKRTHSLPQGPGKQEIVVVEAREPWCCHVLPTEPIRSGEIILFLNDQPDVRISGEIPDEVGIEQIPVYNHQR